MKRRQLNLVLDWCLAPSALILFATGLLLLLRFHVGGGASATSALGVDRLIWVNLHRFSAVFVVAAVAAHVALHWRAFVFRFAEAFGAERRGWFDVELVMYAVCVASALTGFIAWLVLAGSTPLFGPAAIGRLSETRHHWIDAHHIVSLVTLILVSHHFGHRFRSMTGGPRRPPSARVLHGFG